MLGLSVSQATVSRYLPKRSRRPGQSWRTFIRNQAMVFDRREYAEERSRADAGLNIESYQARLERSGAAWVATLWASLMRALAQEQPTLKVAGISLRSAHCDRGVTHRSLPCPAAQGQRCISDPPLLFRSEVHRVKLAAARLPWPLVDSRHSASAESHQNSSRRVVPGRRLESSAAKRAVAVSSRVSMCMH
jgi:hypothetical protein